MRGGFCRNRGNGRDFPLIIIFFEEDTPLNLIKQINPDILVKGGDYKKEQVVGYDIVNTTIIFDYVNGYSSTKAIKYLSDR